MEKKRVEKGRRQYDPEFREDVLKMVFSGRSVSEVATSLGIRENLIHQWKVRYQKSKETSTPGSNVAADGIVTFAEHERIKGRLREVEQERDILKKALGIFSRGI